MASARKALQDGEDPQRAASKKRKRNRAGEAQTNQHRRPENEDAAGQNRAIETTGRKKRRSSANASTEVSNPQWAFSNSSGGHFVDHEPLFSADEEFLISAKRSSIEVYSIETSLLVQRIPVSWSTKATCEVSSFAFSRSNPSYLWVSILDRGISLVDWTRGTSLGSWKTDWNVHTVFVAQANASHQDLVISREQDSKGWEIRARLLSSAPITNKSPDQKTLYESSKPINHLTGTVDGRLLLASSGSDLLVGIRSEDGVNSLDNLNYTWRELQTSGYITCIDLRQVSSKTKLGDEPVKTARHQKFPVIDVAIGDVNGVVTAYEDLGNFLMANDTETNEARTPQNYRKMHWHRQAVASIRWSIDGNYIISGGSETVMVFWQLDTGKHQYLPHLSSAIQQVSLSADGTQYALNLADNSIVVLSAADLTPKAYLAGIQGLSYPRRAMQDLPTRNVDDEDADSEESIMNQLQMPCALHPFNPSQLFTGALSSQPSKHSPNLALGNPYLQTFDMSTSRHLAHQALTRTNSTTVNQGPDHNKIREPTVQFVVPSHDGKWLASVDTWTAPRQDVDPSSIEQDARPREVHLKFWSWDPSREIWQLVSRVDAPHGQPMDNPANFQVKDLKANPSWDGFATIGEDNKIRMWRLKVRTKYSKQPGGPGKEDVVSWVCHAAVELDGSATSVTSSTSRSSVGYRLAHSEDGSIVAASQPLPRAAETSVIHLIDGFTGQVRHTSSRASRGKVIAMEFIGPCLVVVSEQIAVWNIVDDALIYSLPLKLNKSSPNAEERALLTHLAIDQASGSFVVSIPIVNKGNNDRLTSRAIRKAESQITIFSPHSPSPLFSHTSPVLVTALLGNPSAHGYLTVDLAAEVRGLTPRGTVNALGDVQRAAQDLYEDDETPLAIGSTRPPMQDWRTLSADDIPSDDENPAPPVIRQEQLSELFDTGPAYAMPPIAELFDQVAALCSNEHS